jgi:hypothetical protein
MTPPDLLFLAAVLLVLALSGSIALSALRGRWNITRRLAWLLGLFVACYAVVLISVALLHPRRFYAAGERRCFDDWCITALDAKAADASADPACPSQQGSRTWVAEAEVSSVARRVRQRARDARVELEDGQGRRYEACAAPQRPLSDEIGPGESFRVSLPFRLPDGAEPAGLIVHHGDFPGLVIIGADQSFLHPLALQRLTAKRD